MAFLDPVVVKAGQAQAAASTPRRVAESSR
jgi:hypothetical protein